MTSSHSFPSFWFALLANRTQLEIRGADRASFLHNFCTQDIKKLAVGAGAEAFITSHQGKALGYGYLFNEGEWLLLDTTPGEAEKLRLHLDRFVISEQVEFADRSAELCVFLIAGEQAEQRLQALLQASPPTLPLSHLTIEFTLPTTSFPLTIRRGTVSELPCWYLVVSHEQAEVLTAALQQAGTVQQDANQVTAFRIAANIPEYQSEVLEDNLPQEIDRDAIAISFKKGCYLGQETVARLDALGHVNRVLRRATLSSEEVPSAGTELFLADKSVGKILSAAKLPSGEVVAFAMVRRLHAKAGTLLTLASGTATVQ